MKYQIELNRMHNQHVIDNDYRECPECGKILHDLYCGEHVCGCVQDKWEDMKDALCCQRLPPMRGIRDDLDSFIDPMGFPCRIVSTPFGDRISFGCRIIGGIDFGKEEI